MTNTLTWGAEPLLWGDAELLWGFLPAFISDDVIIAGLLHAQYPDGTIISAWTGVGDVTLGGIDYTSVAPHIVEIGSETSNIDGSGKMSITIADIGKEQRTMWLDKVPGQVVVTVRLAYSEDGGTTFLLAPRSFSGILANAKLRGAAYSFEITTSTEDADRGFTATWDDVNQKARFNGDRGFEHLKQIASGIPLNWPPQTR